MRAADLAPVEQRPARQLVADALRRTIALGVYLPGDRLPTERELAVRLAVSRVTVRAAIRILNAEGLLATSRGRTGGSVVADGTPPGPLDGPAEAYLRDVHATYELRLTVEPVAAALAAERAAPEERRALVAIAATPFADAGTYRALDSRFHLTLAEATRNPHLLDAAARARASFFGWAVAIWDPAWDAFPESYEASARQHHEIAAAIDAADAAAASEAMREHLAFHAAHFADLDRRLSVRPQR